MTKVEFGYLLPRTFSFVISIAHNLLFILNYFRKNLHSLKSCFPTLLTLHFNKKVDFFRQVLLLLFLSSNTIQLNTLQSVSRLAVDPSIRQSVSWL